MNKTRNLPEEYFNKTKLYISVNLGNEFFTNRIKFF